MPPPQQVFSNFSRKQEELSWQTKFLAVDSFLGHMSMKNFSDPTYRLGSKIRQREGAAVDFLTYFCNNEDDIQSYQILAWSKMVQR